MSGGRFLLLFLSDGMAPPHGWLRIADGMVSARGRDPDIIPPAEGEAIERIVLVVPGPDVAIHWIELPATSQPQAVAAARIMAAEVSAEPVERLHVAVGPPIGAARAMAIVSAQRMALWLGQAQAIGLDPDHVLPETLLIMPPEEGLRRWDLDEVHVVRGEGVALAAEPALAALATADAPVETIDDEAVERMLAEAIEAAPVDLRQGAFARRRRLAVDWPLVRRLAAIAGLIMAVTLLIQIVLILKYSMAADRLERDVESIARKALPRAERIANPRAQLSERLGELRGGGLGYGATAAAVFAAVRDSANIEMTAMQFDPQGSLRATVQAPSEADITAFQQRLRAQGFEVVSGGVRPGGGRQIAELTVTAR